MSEMRHLGNFAACEPWAAVGMQCDQCDVTWTGCWDNFQCPMCGEGELPSIEQTKEIDCACDGEGCAECDHKGHLTVETKPVTLEDLESEDV